jgi:putative sterol carrier protein
MAFVSLIIKNPFTLQHAKEQVIEAVWNTPAFISVNYVLTWIFAIVFAINAVISTIWGFYSLAIHVVNLGLLFVAIAFTKVLPKYYVPYYMRKYGEKAKPKDLSKMPLRLIFEGMIARFNAQESKGWNTVIQYNITGEGGGKFYVEIENQKCMLEEGEAVNPKLIITVGREDWVAIAEGRLEGQKAFMEGRMKVEGDMNQLFRMQGVFQTRR